MEPMAERDTKVLLGTVYALLAAAGFGALVPAIKTLTSELAPLLVAGIMLVGAGIGALAVWALPRNHGTSGARSEGRTSHAARAMPHGPRRTDPAARATPHGPRHTGPDARTLTHLPRSPVARDQSHFTNSG